MRTLALLACAALLASCAQGGSHHVIPGKVPGATSPSGFTPPPNLSRPAPPPPPAMIPAGPTTASSVGRRPSGAHASFFAGEAALSNGVYYLALPNGNVFGYYSYLPDPHYIYHFDIGYLYVSDANDNQGGVYFYDFTSLHWWYTGRQYPFPYVYDFSLKALLYYYPDTSKAGHYTTGPRFFYNFGFGGVVSSPPSIVTTYAGGNAVKNNTACGYTDGPATAAQFGHPTGVAVDGSGNVYVADYFNNKVRKIVPGSVTSTLAGSGDPDPLGGYYGGYADGAGSSAQFWNPLGVAVDRSGYVYVADATNNRIRKITPAGVVSTLAGSGPTGVGYQGGFADGTGATALFAYPSGVAVDASGIAYVADTDNNAIRKVTSGGDVSTLAGNGAAGSADGTGSAAQFSRPQGVALDGSGNVYVADSQNHRIRKITPGGAVSTIAGGTFGYADGIGASAQFNTPTGVAVDDVGMVYVVDSANGRIREVTPGGVVSTIAGNGVTGAGQDGTGPAAGFNDPGGLAVDGHGRLYVAERGQCAIRRIQ